MNADTERTSLSQVFGLAPLSMTAAWLKSAMTARQTRKAEKEAIKYLRTLNRRQLDDIGVNVAELLAIAPSLPRHGAKEAEGEERQTR